MKKIFLTLSVIFLTFTFSVCADTGNNTGVVLKIEPVDFKIFDLSKYQSIGVKTFGKRDSIQDKHKSIQATNSLAQILGDRKIDFKTRYIYFGKNVHQKYGIAKWNYFYPPSYKGRGKGELKYETNTVMQAGKSGDTLVIAKKSDTEITLILIEKDSPQQKELLAFLSSEQPDKTINDTNINIKENYEIERSIVPQKTWARVYFTPSLDCENNIIEQIERSKKIEIAVYSITNDRIVDALVKAKTNGAKIRIITDRLQSKGRASLIPTLEQEGFVIKTNIKHKIMHHKFAIFDGQDIENGSYNWTTSASKSNAENCMFFKQNNKEFTEQFDYLWKLYQQ